MTIASSCPTPPVVPLQSCITSRRGDSTLDLLAGLRYLSFKERLEWSFTGSVQNLPAAVRSGNAEISNENVDAIVGVKGKFQADGGWSVPIYLDVGTGESQFTWQGATGLAYAFRWGELSLLFRYLDYRVGSKTLNDLTITGPMVGATFRW